MLLNSPIGQPLYLDQQWLTLLPERHPQYQAPMVAQDQQMLNQSSSVWQNRVMHQCYLRQLEHSPTPKRTRVAPGATNNSVNDDDFLSECAKWRRLPPEPTNNIFITTIVKMIAADVKLGWQS